MISSDVKSRMFFFKKKNGGTDFLFQEKVLYRIYLTCSKLEYFVICFFFLKICLLRNLSDYDRNLTKKRETQKNIPLPFPELKETFFSSDRLKNRQLHQFCHVGFFVQKRCVWGGGQELGLKNVESTDSKSFLATPQSNKNWLFMGWNTSVLQKKKTLISKSLKMQSPSLFRLVPLNFLFVHEDFKKDIFIQTVFF